MLALYHSPFHSERSSSVLEKERREGGKEGKRKRRKRGDGRRAGGWRRVKIK